MDFDNVLERYHVSGYEEDLGSLHGRDYEKTQFGACLEDALLDETLGLSQCFLYYITGPIGSGKSYLARCFAESMHQVYYDLFAIDFEELMEEEDPEKILEDILREIEYRTNPEDGDGQKIFLLMEKPAALKGKNKAVRILSRGIRKLIDGDCKCILVMCGREYEEPPLDIIKLFDIIQLDLPDEELRMSYFEEVMTISFDNPALPAHGMESGSELESDEVLGENTSDTIDFYALDFSSGAIGGFCAELTDGFNFHQLEQITNHTVRKVKQKMMTFTQGRASEIYRLLSEGQSKQFSLTEDEFKEIVNNIKQTAVIHERSAATGYGHKNSGAGNAAIPQVIYQQVPVSSGVMPGMMGMMGMPQQIQGNISEKDILLAQADQDNPDVSTLLSAFNSVERDISADAAAYGVDIGDKDNAGSAKQQDNYDDIDI